ncbi:MAG: RNA polymerase factor sigma-32 [Paracoccaceae bacterium]|jgi:RNA polymerase sigma-32 factor
MTQTGMTDDSLPRQMMAAEYLDAETEAALARAWRDQRDEAALHRLITAYMRLAIAMAAKYRRYGAPMNDLIQEASLGLMKAADKFDPDRGVRFSTYAVWWIKAAIQDFVMRNWSLVRTGSTSSQKALFFNLRRVQAQIERESGAEGVALDGAQIRQRVAEEIGVPLADVEMMQGRLSASDFSLDAPQAGEDEGRAWVETIEDEGPGPEAHATDRHDRARMREWLGDALNGLSARERYIVAERRLNEVPRTLESLGDELGLSKERVRQLEAQAFGKMRKSLARHADEVQNFFA